MAGEWEEASAFVVSVSVLLKTWKLPFSCCLSLSTLAAENQTQSLLVPYAYAAVPAFPCAPTFLCHERKWRKLAEVLRCSKPQTTR